MQQSIENFVKQYNSEATKKQYKSFLVKLDNDIGLNNDAPVLKAYVENLKLGDKTKQDKCFIIIAYLKYAKKPLFTFDKKPIERDVANKPKLADRKELQDVLNKAEINNIEHKLLLSLLLNYPQVLRTDLADVKVKNFDKKVDPHYFDGNIVFPVIRKTKFKSIVMVLNDADKVLADQIVKNATSEFLLTISSKDRNNSYTKLIKRITKKYLGTSLSQTNFRSILASDDAKEFKVDRDFIDKVNILENRAKLRGHSLLTSLNKYTKID